MKAPPQCRPQGVESPAMKSVHAPRLWAEPTVARPPLSICKFILQTLLTVKSDLSHQNIFHID